MPPARRRSGAGSGRWRRPALLILLVAALTLPLTAGAATAAPKAKPAKPVTTSYENPLAPVIPGTDSTVDSCADPMVLKGQQPGDRYWYMYCTTDPLHDEDRNAQGGFVFHRVPQMRSLDLVNWTYVGDAFAQGAAGLPSWAADAAALWAPEVVYSTTFRKYYMFVGVTDTDESVSGEPNCNSDNAIGVATSASATGPWTFSETPVVAPRRGGGGCNFLWTYDPDVLGDAIATTSTLYYGSYYGGVYGSPLTLTATGASAGTTADDTMVAIDNKYEGTNVVLRDGWYYIFLSATNCCNGALTGYSVFVGRSRTPLGPFVDQQGNSLVDAQAGGTPFLTMNGNRWVGTGHNTVFQDAAGDWWTIYHAVDQQDPFFEGTGSATALGFTKRPALLDPIDWVNGWPTVNGGAGPSDTKMPAPAAQPGQRSRHKTRLVAEQVPGRTVFADGFDGSRLNGDWTWVRPPAAGEYAVEGGVLEMDIQRKELFQDFNTASVLLHAAPRRDYVVETKVRVDVPDEGCCFNYAQAGLIVYGDDNNFVKLTNTSIWNTRQTEWAKEMFPVPVGWARYGNTVVGPPSEGWTYLRVVVERLTGKDRREAGGDTGSYTAYTSQDGRNWVRGGTWTHTLGDARIGLIAMGQQPETPGEWHAEFDYVRISTLSERGRGR